MDLHIERSGSLPVHIQLKEQIRFLILDGQLADGTRLPTARSLSAYLRINRNTVLRAYQELAREKLIECRPGRGCVVTHHDTARPGPRLSKLISIVDAAAEQAQRLGVGPDALAAMAYQRARRGPHRARVVMVECEAAMAASLASGLAPKVEADLQPVELSELRAKNAAALQSVRDADLVATTFFHIDEVRHLVRGLGKRTVALVIKPHLEGLVRVASIPAGTRVALVCVNDSRVREFESGLSEAGIRHLKTTLVSADPPRLLAQKLRRVPVVVASSLVEEPVKAVLRPDQDLILLDCTTPDDAAAEMLNAMLGADSQAASRRR